jgi:TolB protein
MKPDNQKEPTVSKLLFHLQEMRESVPINLQLKKDLKQELVKRMQQMNLSMGETFSEVPYKKQSKWRWGVLASALVILLVIFAQVWSPDIEMHALDSELLTSTEAVISPDGKQIASVGDGILNIVDLEGKGIVYHAIPLPDESDKIDSMWENPTWSPDQQMVAITQTNTNKSQVWIISVNSRSSRLLIEEERVAYGQMAWSPDLQWLMITQIDNGHEALQKVNVSNSVVTDWGVGSEPAWSPDGKTIAFLRNGEIILSSLDGSGEKNIGIGQSPIWSEESVLHFIADDPLSLKYSDSTLSNSNVSDLNPVGINSLEIPVGSKEARFSLSLSADGKKMLWIESFENSKPKVFWAEINR